MARGAGLGAADPGVHGVLVWLPSPLWTPTTGKVKQGLGSLEAPPKAETPPPPSKASVWDLFSKSEECGQQGNVWAWTGALEELTPKL